ncbi:MAG TPA: heme-binding protein [Vicinamibacterales bacterium]|nr:heme-binding protein [Vicinamibacterales bacterium]
MRWLARIAGLTVLIAASAAAARSDEQITLNKRVLTLAAARKIVDASEAAARARGVGVVTVVVDDAGNVIQLSRMDTAQVASINVGIGKARTAAIYRRPSRVFEEQIKSGRVAALALADATPLQGGVPILIGGAVVGAVGVSGDTPQVDEDIALAGAAAVAETEAGSVARDGRRIIAVTLIHGLPGQAADLKAHLLSLTGPTRAEPGSLAYELYQSPQSPHEFMRFEVWKNRDALELHKTLPHLRASFEKRQREGWKTEIMVFERVPEESGQ